MKLRMTLATSLAATVLLALAGCNSDDKGATPEPSSSTSATPTAAETPGAKELVGDWADTEAEWAVHFNDDGTFVEDFQGNINFRVGTYKVEGETVSLIGDDGNTTTGTVTGVTLVFKLGTLIRD
ncbi:MAG: hypothetical protein ABIN55_06945 [Aeromicrobium sp.]